MLAKNICGIVGVLLWSGGRSWSFQTPNLEVIKAEKVKVSVLISIILCAGSVASYASLHQILCLNICE